MPVASPAMGRRDGAGGWPGRSGTVGSGPARLDPRQGRRWRALWRGARGEVARGGLASSSVGRGPAMRSGAAWARKSGGGRLRARAGLTRAPRAAAEEREARARWRRPIG